MVDRDSCCCEKRYIVYACCGGSNVGQITNEVAKLLDRAGDTKFSCMAGVGGRVSGIIESAKGADGLLVLDGCTIVCGRRCMELAGIEKFGHLVVSELGIEKTGALDPAPTDVEKTLAVACEKLNSMKVNCQRIPSLEGQSK